MIKEEEIRIRVALVDTESHHTVLITRIRLKPCSCKISSLIAIMYTPYHKELFKRLVSKHGIKMKGVVAVQRKLLVLIYTLWKKEEDFDQNKCLTILTGQPEKTT